jgi:hypothetical protein
MEKKFADAHPIAVQIALEAADVPQALLPEVGRDQLRREVLLLEQGRMHPDHEDLLIVTNGVSRLQTNEPNSTCQPSCHGHTLPPHWSNRATLPGAEESMTTTFEFITALFCQVDDQLADLPKHPEAHLWPSEVVTLGLLHALKGIGNRPF